MKWNGQEWNGQKWNKDKTIFFVTILFMIMIGVLFNQDINKGLFKENIIEPIIIKQPIEQFSPQPIIMSFLPILAAIIIITLTILKKEDIINEAKTQKIVKISKFQTKKVMKLSKKQTQKQIKQLINRIKKIHKKIENIKGINVKKTIKYRPDLRKHYYLHIYPIIGKELTKTKELWIGEYTPKHTPKFIAMLLVTTVITMSIFSFTSFNKGLVKETITQIKIIQTPLIQLSPPDILNTLPFILALVIITLASYLKIKRDSKK